MKLTKFFERVEVINLDRRSDRWGRFCERLDLAGISRDGVMRRSAVDGALVPSPGWWAPGQSCRDSSWGCLQTHVRVMQDAMSDGVDSVLIFEDDACFADSFCEALPRLCEEVSDGWQMLYLGGQHRLKDGPPWFEFGKEEVIRARSVIRTHAFAVHSSFFKTYLKHITDYPKYERGRVNFHVDHSLSQLHMQSPAGVYCAFPWISGQAQGYSDIQSRSNEEKWWQVERSRISSNPQPCDSQKKTRTRKPPARMYGVNGPVSWF